MATATPAAVITDNEVDNQMLHREDGSMEHLVLSSPLR